MRLINRSVRHWVIGSKSHIEFTGTDNIFHFGNTAKIYNVYTIILEEIQNIFSITSCEEAEEINFFLVPDNSIRTSSAILFPSLTPEFKRLISVNLSTEIIFDFQMIGLLMHEIGQFICHQREERNKLYLSLITRDFASNLVNYFFTANVQDMFHFFNEYNENDKFPKSYIENHIYSEIYKDFSNRVYILLEKSIKALIKRQLSGDGYSIYNSPMDTYSDFIKAIMPNDNDINEDSEISNFDNVLENSKYHHLPIDVPDNFWNQFIYKDDDESIENLTFKNNNDLISIIMDLPNIIDEWENKTLEAISYFFDNRRKLKDLEIFLSIKLTEKTQDFYFNQIYNFKTLIFDTFCINKKYQNYTNVQIKKRFLKFEDEILIFLRKCSDNDEFLEQEILEKIIKNKVTLQKNNENQKKLNSIIDKYFTINSDNRSYMSYIIIEYYNQVYLYDYEDLLMLKNHFIYHLRKDLNQKKIFSGTKSDIKKIITELKEILKNQRPYQKNSNAYLYKSLSHTIKQNKELIKETKADYFMIQILQMEKEDYLKHYQVNTDPELELRDFESQMNLRLDILNYACAFSHNKDRNKNLEKNNKEIQKMNKKELISYIIQRSVDPVLLEFENSKIIHACSEIFQEQKSGISNDLEFISKILKLSNGFEKE